MPTFFSIDFAVCLQDTNISTNALVSSINILCYVIIYIDAKILLGSIGSKQNIVVT